LDWPLRVSFLRNCRFYFVSQGDYVNITRSHTQTIERWSALSLILVTWAMHVMDCNRVYYDVKMEGIVFPPAQVLSPSSNLVTGLASPIQGRATVLRPMSLMQAVRRAHGPEHKAWQDGNKAWPLTVIFFFLTLLTCEMSILSHQRIIGYHL
jgi:hypothetical protein